MFIALFVFLLLSCVQYLIGDSFTRTGKMVKLSGFIAFTILSIFGSFLLVQSNNVEVSKVLHHYLPATSLIGFNMIILPRF